jgi:large subunit ribosomal protein L6
MEIVKNIEIPEKVVLSVQNSVVRVKGPKGEIEKTFGDPRFEKVIKLEVNENKFIVSTSSEKKKVKAMVGTIISHVNNMIIGVTKGYQYKLKIYSVHFPINITFKDKKIQIKNFIGEKTLRFAKAVGNVDVKIDKDEIMVSGINKEEVGHTCTNIEKATRLSKRDRRIFQDGIYLSGRYLQTGENA